MLHRSKAADGPNGLIGVMVPVVVYIALNKLCESENEEQSKAEFMRMPALQLAN